MTREQSAPALEPFDWNNFDLVVFDVDGTLYDQKRLRSIMLRKLLVHAWRSGSLDTALTLRTFRKVREQLGDAQEPDFMRQQYARTALRHRKTPDQVQAMATEWLERLPLPLLGDCRFPHLAGVFDGLRAAGKKVAVFSDYPAVDKLAALGLRAEPVVCATDADIGRLKPDPSGLLAVLRRTGVSPRRALMIGDRGDRDGAAASRAGVRALIRSRRPVPGFDTFRAYDDPLFQPLLARAYGPMAA